MLGLAAAVVFVIVKIPSEQEELENKRKGLLAPKIKPLTNLDLTLSDAALKRVAGYAVRRSTPTKGESVDPIDTKGVSR